MHTTCGQTLHKTYIYTWYQTGVAVLTVDSVGRRPLLLGGVSAMVVALLALGGSQLVLSGGIATWTSVLALLFYVGAYQVSTVLLLFTLLLGLHACKTAKC